VEAALHLFAENGFHSAPMSRLAEMAGVGVGSIYRYFKDKDRLVHAVFEHVDQALNSMLTASFHPDLSDRDQLIRMLTHIPIQGNSGFWNNITILPMALKKNGPKFPWRIKPNCLRPCVSFSSGIWMIRLKNFPGPFTRP